MALLRITTLTPVHVGSGKTLTQGVDFEVDTRDSAVHILDLHKIFAILGPQYMDQWLEIIENKKNSQEKQPLLRLLKKVKPSLAPPDYAQSSIPYVHHHGKKTELYLHLRNGAGWPYIPGTSLKGSLRTALLTHLIIRPIQGVKNKIKIHEKINKRGKTYYTCNDKALINFLARDDQNQRHEKDFLRFLRVGDAHFSQTKIFMVQAYTLNSQGWKKRDDLAQWTECLPPDSKAYLRLQPADEILAKNYDKPNIRKELEEVLSRHYSLAASWQVLCDRVNQHTQRLLESELDTRRALFNSELASYRAGLEDLLKRIQALPPGQCILRLGKHTGFASMTGGWQEEILDEEDFLKLKRYVRRSQLNRAGRDDAYDTYPLPKTRRFTPEGAPLGFVLLEWVRPEEQAWQELFPSKAPSAPGPAPARPGPPTVGTPAPTSPAQPPSPPPPFTGKIKEGVDVPAFCIGSRPSNPNYKILRLLVGQDGPQPEVEIHYPADTLLQRYCYVRVKAIQKGVIVAVQFEKLIHP